MKPSRNVLLLLFALAAWACPGPKPGTDRADTGIAPAADATPKPDAASNADAAPNTDAEHGDATEPDGGHPDAEPIDMGVDAGEPGCIPTGPEVCMNGIDDDCQNGLDCNDPACGQCLPAPSPFTAGVFVDALQRCPAGFEVAETTVYAGLNPGPGCSGTCSCMANPIRCLAEVYTYATEAQCLADTALTGGTLYNSLIDENCTMMPIHELWVDGYRLGNWTVEQTCSPSGTAAPSPYSWAETKKLCVAQLGIHGCDRDAVCVPSNVRERACLMTSGGASCPGVFSDRATQYYTGLSDTRSCGPCDCTASGGSCQFAQLAIGSDWICTDDFYLSQASPQRCFNMMMMNSGPYSPPARVTGSPTDPTCSTFALEDGAIQATDQQTLCCLP